MMSNSNSENPFPNIDTGSSGKKSGRKPAGQPVNKPASRPGVLPVAPSVRQRHQRKKYPSWLISVIATTSILAILALGGIVALAMSGDSKPVAKKKKSQSAKPRKTVTSDLPDGNIGKGMTGEKNPVKDRVGSKQPNKKQPKITQPEKKQPKKEQPDRFPPRKEEPPNGKKPVEPEMIPATEPPSRYLADMTKAFQQIQAHNYPAAETLMAKYLPGTGQKDERHLEWFFMRGLLHGYAKQLQLEKEPIQCLDIDSEKNQLAFGTRSGKVKIVDLESGKTILELEQGNQAIAQVSLIVDRVVVADVDGVVKLFSRANGDQVATIEDPSNLPTRKFSSRKDSIATLKDSVVQVWDIDGKLKHSVKHGDGEEVVDYLLGQGAGHVVTLAKSGELRDFDPRSKRLHIREFERAPNFLFPTGNPSMIGLAYDHEHIATPRKEPDPSQLRNYRMRSTPDWRKLQFATKGYRGRFFCGTDHELTTEYGAVIGISPSKINEMVAHDMQLVTCHEDGTIKFWDTDQKTLGQKRYRGVGSTSQGSFTRDGNFHYIDPYAAKQDKAGYVKSILLSASGETQTWLLDREADAFAISRDGKIAMTYELVKPPPYIVNSKPRINFWNFETQELIRSIVLVGAHKMESPVFSLDGTKLYCQLTKPGAIGSVEEIDVESGNRKQIARAYSGAKMAIDPEGSLFRVTRLRSTHFEIHHLLSDRKLTTPVGENNTYGKPFIDYSGKHVANGWRFANVYRISDGKKVFSYRPEKTLHQTVVSPDAKRVLIVAHEDYRIVDLESGYSILQWDGKELIKPFNSSDIQISLDNRWIVGQANGIFVGPNPGDPLGRRTLD